MQMKISNLILLSLSFLASIVSQAQSATDYKLLFDKTDVGAGTIKIKCELTIDFDGKDSLLMDFGGSLEEESVSELSIVPADIRYHFKPNDKKICFYKKRKERVKVSMEYVYMNLTSVLMYVGSGAEIWECIQTHSGEFYYPMNLGDIYAGKVKFTVPDSLEVISSANKEPEKWHKIEQMVPLNFAFLEKSIYEKQTLENKYLCDVYQVIGKQADTSRVSELNDLTVRAIEWFESKYGETFVNPHMGTYYYPAFIFHGGNSSFNRYNMGFISASQEKFATYPDIYPLIHEIGHRWFGEYSMFIESGQKGYAFVIETLNEFMTLMCIRDIIGIEEYERIINNYRLQWENIKDTPKDIDPVDVTEINNIPVTYRKGPVMLDNIARTIGYEKLVSSIVDYYRQYKGQQGLEFQDLFLQIAAELN